MEEHQADIAPKKKSRTLIRFGIGLIVVSCFLYAAILLVPLTDFSTGTKVAITGGLVVGGEVTFWVGGIIVGKEAVSRYRKNLHPKNWLRGGKKE